MPCSADLKSDHKEEIQQKHEGGNDRICNFGCPALRVCLEWALRCQLDTKSTCDDSKDDKDATEPKMGPAGRCPARRFGGLAGFDSETAFLVDAVVDVAEDGLEEGEGKDSQTHTRVRVVPDAVVLELLCEPDAHSSRSDEEDVAEDLADGVDPQDDGVLDVQPEQNGEGWNEEDPDQRGQDCVGDEDMRGFVELTCRAEDGALTECRAAG